MPATTEFARASEFRVAQGAIALKSSLRARPWPDLQGSEIEIIGGRRILTGLATA